MKVLKEYSRIVITGGTGSFGRRFIRLLLGRDDCPEQVVVLSRDEFKQYEMRQHFPAAVYPQLRFILGDVRDREKLNQVFRDCDLVIHAAALKQVDTSELNPMEYIKTNVLGAENVIQASIQNEVKKVIALSSDKAVRPISLYGASKLSADKLFLAANSAQFKQRTCFAVARYGNVLGSRASVVPLFLKKARAGEKLPLTHAQMTRFSVPVGVESNLIFFAIEHSRGGEIFIPKVPSYRVQDLIKAIAPRAEIEYRGLRSGEKIHEELIPIEEAPRSYDLGDFLAIIPPAYSLPESWKDRQVEPDFQYNSQDNSNFLSQAQIMEEVMRISDYESLD